MLTNYHTHTVFCDGKSTAEEMVLSAISKGFCSLGFSGHAYNEYDVDFCMTDTEGYISEIRRLKEKYKDKIEIYLGIEEDLIGEVNRADFEYIIGSSHSFLVDGKYYSIDADDENFKKCIELFEGDVIALSEAYYSRFCDYILRRKPDIVGHFDIITKFDELDLPLFLNNEEYFKVAEKYLNEAIKSDAIFEVNTGAVSRGYRSSPYPHERLLHLLRRNNGKIILSSDCHSADALDCRFDETKALLRDIGFEYTYMLYKNEWKKDRL